MTICFEGGFVASSLLDFMVHIFVQMFLNVLRSYASRRLHYFEFMHGFGRFFMLATPSV